MQRFAGAIVLALVLCGTAMAESPGVSGRVANRLGSRVRVRCEPAGLAEGQYVDVSAPPRGVIARLRVEELHATGFLGRAEHGAAELTPGLEVALSSTSAPLAASPTSSPSASPSASPSFVKGTLNLGLVAPSGRSATEPSPSPSAAAAPSSPTTSVTPVGKDAWAGRFDWIDIRHGGRPLAVPPFQYEYFGRAPLYARDDYSYHAKKVPLPADFSFRFLENAPSARIDTVVVTLTGDEARFPRDVEVLVSVDEDGATLRPAGAFALPKKAGHYKLAFPAVEARALALRVHSVHGPGQIELGRVRALEAPDGPRASETVAGRQAQLEDLARIDVASAALGGRATGNEAAGKDLDPLISGTLDSAWQSTGAKDPQVVLHLVPTDRPPTIDAIVVDRPQNYTMAYDVAVLRVEASIEGADRGFHPLRTMLLTAGVTRSLVAVPPTPARFVRLTPLVTRGLETMAYMGRVRVLEAATAQPASAALAARAPDDRDGAGYDVASVAAGARIASTKPDLSDLQLRGAGNLLRVRDGEGGWVVHRDGERDCHAVIELTAPATIAKLAFTHMQDPDRLYGELSLPECRALTARVAWAPAREGPWSELAPIALDPRLLRQVREVAPFTARYLKVAMRDSAGKRVSLGRLEAYAAPGAEAPRRDLLPFEHGGNLVRFSAGHGYLEHLTGRSSSRSYQCTFDRGKPEITWAFRGWKIARLGELVVHPPATTTWGLPPERIEVLATTGEALSEHRSVGSLALTTEPGPQRLSLGGVAARHVTVRFHPRPGQSNALIRQLELFEHPSGPSVFDGAYSEMSPGEGATVSAATTAAALTEREPNGTPDTAVPLTWETTVTARVDPVDDVDHFLYDHPRDEAFRLTVRQDPFPRVEVAVSDAAGTLVAKALPGQLTDARGLLELPARAGRYTIRVSRPPGSALLLFDTSGSIKSAREQIRQAAFAFVAGAGGREELAAALLPPPNATVVDWLGGFTTKPADLTEPLRQGLERESYSDQPAGLVSALDKLAARPANRSLVMLTDFAPYPCSSWVAVWQAVERTGARLDMLAFAVKPEEEYKSCLLATQRTAMKNLARATGGRFQLAPDPAALGGLYDEVARSLADTPPYALTVGPMPGPGSLSVRLEAPELARHVKPARQLHVILDCSGSMNERVGRERKIDVAKRVMEQVLDQLPEGAPVGLRVYGRNLSPKDPRTCEDIELLVPIGPLRREPLRATVRSLVARGETPLIRSILLGARDFQAGDGERSLLAITDGLESCGGSEADLAQLGGGLDLVRVNVVGFGMGRPQERERLEKLAAACRGSYHDARDAEALAAIVREIAATGWTLTRADGSVVAQGTLVGSPVEVPSGSYTLTVRSVPPMQRSVRIVPRQLTEHLVAVDADRKPFFKR